MKNNKQKNNRKRFILLFLVIILITIMIVHITIPQKITSGTNSKSFLASLGIYNKEVSSVEIKSDGFNNKKAGSYKITKSANWTNDKKARITFNVESVLKSINRKKDVLLVMDVSGSMSGSKLDKAKSDAKELANVLLSDNENSMGVVTFETTGEFSKNFTNNIEEITSYIDSITAFGGTNYNDALLKVGEILANYNKTKKDFIVLFVTDGYPCEDSPNEVATYEILKEKYPYLIINAIQYEMGKEIANEIKNISDAQWSADQTTLGNALLDAVVVPKTYNEFKITDYIDERYFEINNIDDIKVTRGTAALAGNKITWNLGDNSYITGSKETMTIDLMLKGDFNDTSAYFSTNEKEEIIANLDDEDLSKNSKETPVLKSAYRVIYDSNAPDGCELNSLPDETHYVFETVNKTEEKLSCPGYQFKGWEITNDGVEEISDDSFVMPSKDVTIKATWTKQSIEKTMDGTVNGKATLYKVVERDAKKGLHAKEYTGEGSDDYTNKVYYYTYEAQNNNVKFANFCWKMFRTTDTGGVKLLYNGEPNEKGECTGENPIIGQTPYNENDNSLADVGYMFNKRYNSKTVVDDKTVIVTIGGTVSTSGDFSIGDTITYNNGKYEISNKDGSPLKYGVLKDMDESELVDKYICEHNKNTCTKPGYLIKKRSDYQYYALQFEDGTMLDDYKLVIGKSHEGNQLKDVINISYPDFIKSVKGYDQYNGYYVCSNDLTTDTCDSVAGLYSNSDLSINYTSLLFGSSISWDGSSYNLEGVDFGPSKTRHYFCADGNTSCEKIYFLHYLNGKAMSYIELENGKTSDDVMNEMLYNDDVNTTNSLLKETTDAWYHDNMINYTEYLEDTIYCNNRNIGLPYGFDYRNGEFGYLKQMHFDSWSRFVEIRSNLIVTLIASKFVGNPSLSCNRTTDSFTVSPQNGNGKLTYPVGFITNDELSLIIGSDIWNFETNKYNSEWLKKIRNKEIYSYPLSPTAYWTGTPAMFVTLKGEMAAMSAAGYPTPLSASRSFGVRPVISLNNNIGYSDGNGSETTPYVIEEE